MTNRIYQIFILLIALLFFVNCSSQKKIIQPNGNVKSLNTTFDDFAPNQRPDKGVSCEPCSNEFTSKVQSLENGVKPSKKFLTEFLELKYGLYPEAITFITDTKGYFSVAHPPDKRSSDLLGFPIHGFIGGTDIFEFDLDDSTQPIKSLSDTINSIVWDSHPTAVSDDNCNVFLIWSSDRADLGGYSSPFLRIDKIKEISDYSGNSDLFFAFKINGVWSEPKNLKDYIPNLNTTKREETPFLYCNCLKPVLFFSSDRDGDFDIFYVRLSIDFDKQKVSSSSQIVKLPRDNEALNPATINSVFDDFFPFIPKPFSDKKSDNFIYFSSNRLATPKDYGKNTKISSVGGYDIYKFPMPEGLECTPPVITYNIRLIDATNPSNKVIKPIINLNSMVDADYPFTKTNEDENLEEFYTRRANLIEQYYSNNNYKKDIKETVNSNENFVSFKLKPGIDYFFNGGSTQNDINCIEGADRTLSHYAIRKIVEIAPRIEKEQREIEFYEYKTKEKKIGYDTLFNEILIEPSQLNQFYKSENKIESIQMEGEKLKLKYYTIVPRKEVLELDSVLVKKKITIDVPIRQFDTSYVMVNASNLALSEKTKREGLIRFNKIKDDITVEDTIYVWPQYYYYPPCEWRYVSDTAEMRRNVPYFMTCFWEVNTTSNLPRHLNLLKTKRYEDASFIELHKKNQYFGWDRPDITGDRVEQRKQKYANRVERYRQFARIVDENLKLMADEIAKRIIPLFKELDAKSSGNQNKLIIVINGYSDIRPIIRGTYLGEETIKYLSIGYDDETTRITGKSLVEVPPDASLVDPLNDYLSKLRAFNGYREVIKRLEQYPEFKEYIDKGLVLIPEQISSIDEFNKMMEKCKILFFVEGRKIDPNITPNIPAYVGENRDFYILDPVRRIDVIVKRVDYFNGEIQKPKCCKPAD